MLSKQPNRITYEPNWKQTRTKQKAAVCEFGSTGSETNYAHGSSLLGCVWLRSSPSGVRFTSVGTEPFHGANIRSNSLRKNDQTSSLPFHTTSSSLGHSRRRRRRSAGQVELEPGGTWADVEQAVMELRLGEARSRRRRSSGWRGAGRGRAWAELRAARAGWSSGSEGAELGAAQGGPQAARAEAQPARAAQRSGWSSGEGSTSARVELWRGTLGKKSSNVMGIISS